MKEQINDSQSCLSTEGLISSVVITFWNHHPKKIINQLRASRESQIKQSHYYSSLTSGREIFTVIIIVGCFNWLNWLRRDVYSYYEEGEICVISLKNYQWIIKDFQQHCFHLQLMTNIMSLVIFLYFSVMIQKRFKVLLLQNNP